MTRCLAAALLVFASTVPLSGCFACTQIGCEDQVTVELTAASGALVEGAYEVTVVADGVPETCTLTIAADCDSGSTCLQDSTCYLAYLLSGPQRVSLTVSGAPELVTVERAGVEVGRASFSPEYEKLEPNGARCGPTCYVTTQELTIQ